MRKGRRHAEELRTLFLLMLQLRRRTMTLTSTSSPAQITQPWGNYALHDDLHRLLLTQSSSPWGSGPAEAATVQLAV